MNPDIFFPKGNIGHVSKARDAYEKAKAICDICPVKKECLEYALALPANWCEGIWGGTTERERRWLRRKNVSESRGIRKTD
jgi:WhiB family redox-sensing transcriptional regulator